MVAEERAEWTAGNGYRALKGGMAETKLEFTVCRHRESDSVMLPAGDVCGWTV